MKKRLLSILLLLSVLMMLAPGASANTTQSFGQVTAQDVNMRKSASTEAEVLAALSLNEEVEVLGEEGSWYRILYNDMVGYVSQNYVFVNATGSRAAYVTQDGVGLRGAPSEAAYIVTPLYGGQALKVKQMIGNWYFVVAGDQVGYVDRHYVTMTKGTNTASSLLRVGMEGQEVMRLQNELYDRGFLGKVDITGVYGAKTRTAVSEFQKACDLDADGAAGAQTLEQLYDPTNKTSKANAFATQVKGSVTLFNWFEGGAEWLAKGAVYQITDVRTGLSFKVKRFGGWYHADSVPLTAADTAVFKKIVNGKWTWDRRAIWVSYRGRTVAASMNCMPHLSTPIKNNNFPGHFCVHLYKSKVHENSKECPRHQAAVQSAYKAGR